MKYYDNVKIYITYLRNKWRSYLLKIYKYIDGKCNASGPEVKMLREKAGLSQEQLAAKLQLAGLNLNQKAISRIETGERIVADYELITLAEVLDATVNELLRI